MTQSLWLLPSDVREYINLAGTAGRYSDGLLASNIRAAQQFIERATVRQFEVQLATTKVFTTGGKAEIAIPDLTTATSVTLMTTTLTANQSYWLIPDVRQSGVYVAIQTRAFRTDTGAWYLANPQWFDRGLDLPGGNLYSTLPNDLSILGDWGWTDKPMDLLLGVKAYAAWLTKRPDALLANAVQGPDGSILDYSVLPPETTEVLYAYRRGRQAVTI